MRRLTLALLIGTVLTNNAVASNVVEQQAEKAGVKKCLPAVKFISDYLIEKGDAGAHSVWSSGDPDKQIFTAAIERNYSDGPVLTNVTVAPTTSGECATVYDQIFHAPKSCMALAKETFENYEYKATINKEISILESKGGANVYLMRTEGGGCIAMKKEVLMNAAPSK